MAEPSVGTEPEVELDRATFRAAYRAFLRPGRILLTGHSHQAWPDCARSAALAAFDDAARYGDDKWVEAVQPEAARLGARLAPRLGFSSADDVALAPNTHTLVYALLSAVTSPVGGRPHGGRDARVVTTTAEFHSLDRQLRRASEEGLRVDWVEAEPRGRLTERLLRALEQPADLLALSAVLFEDAYVVDRLGEVVSAAVDSGATVLVDAYHAFNVVPLDWGPARDQLYVVAGGYKYAQLGEGVCFMRLPPACSLRPAFTGWYADFAGIATRRARAEPVAYGTGAARFAGATFDPTSIYRAHAVLDHFEAFVLDPARLRRISQRQTARIVERALEADLRVDSSLDSERRGGFVALRVDHADAVVAALRRRGVFVDARGGRVRVGPAPYLVDDEIDAGMAALADVVRSVA